MSRYASHLAGRSYAPLGRVLDCPPRADGVLTANALRACDLAILVVEAGAFALQGAVRAIDVAATAARLLGIEPPAHSEGRPIALR